MAHIHKHKPLPLDYFLSGCHRQQPVEKPCPNSRKSENNFFYIRRTPPPHTHTQTHVRARTHRLSMMHLYFWMNVQMYSKQAVRSNSCLLCATHDIEKHTFILSLSHTRKHLPDAHTNTQTGRMVPVSARAHKACGGFIISTTEKGPLISCVCLCVHVYVWCVCAIMSVDR